MHFMFLIFVLFHVPHPNPHSVLLHITSPCSIFVPMLFCPNPCPFPSTLLCSFDTYTFITSCMFPSLNQHRLSPLNSHPFHPNLPNSLEPPSIQIEDKRTSGGEASKLKPRPCRTLLLAVIVGSSRELQVTL